MRTHQIEIGSEDTVVLNLPDGQRVSIQLNHLDPDALPELDLWFETDQTVNGYRDGLKPATPYEGQPNAMEVRQLIIPIHPTP